MSIFLGVVIGLIILTVLVVFHEFGHAFAAIRSGVVVEEFGIGFPPKVWACKLKNGVLFSLNALPIGGFVKMQGEYDSSNQKGDYGAATFWQKTKILLAGVCMNWLLAAVLLTILALVGLPKVLDNQFMISSDSRVIYQPVTVAEVVPGYPAAKAGLSTGDQIIAFDNQKISTVDQLLISIKQNKGKNVKMVYRHNGVNATSSVLLKKQSSSSGILGVSLGQTELLHATWSAPIVGVATTAQFTYITFQGLGTILANLATGITGQFSSNSNERAQARNNLNSAGASVAGPVGILGVIFPAAEKAGFTQMVFLAAIISLSLAVMNILPIPTLDGGRWLLMGAFKLFHKKLTKEIEEKVQTAGFLIIIGLVIVVTIADVGKII